jgi:hypothetical protein
LRWILWLPLAMSMPGALAAPGEESLARGLVFEDADQDGRRARTRHVEPGVEGIKVSNGRDVVLTDGQGRFSLRVRPGDTVFVIKPRDYELLPGAAGRGRSWAHHMPSGSPALRYRGIARQRARSLEFALSKRPGGPPATTGVLLFGDPQIKSAADVDYYARDIVAPLQAAPDAAFGISLGDIANDDLSLYDGIDAVTARLGIPWLHVPGNHDLDFDATRDEDSLLSWRAHYGPDTYAWETEAANFVLLDDVIWSPPPAPAPNYVGGLREAQFEFLQNYLPTLTHDRRLVIAAHIPFHGAGPGQQPFRAADRERLFALLRPFPHVLLLTAHAHAQRHYFHGREDGWDGAEPLHEYVVGTASGGFWSGLPDAEGIPDARMFDGTPNGYARLRIERDGSYRLRYHAARDPADTRIALHAPRVLRRGAYPAATVTANVYMGAQDTRVEYRIDAGDWKPMTRSNSPDPALVALNVADDAAPTLRSYDRAVEAMAATGHHWRGALPTDLAPGEHRIEVRAFDRWDGELRAATSYRLEARDPP